MGDDITQSFANPIGYSASPWNWSMNDVNSTMGINGGDPTNADRDALRGIGANASAMGGQLAGNYQANANALNQSYGNIGQTQQYLANQMRGGNSVSQLQLQQGLAQQMAQQRQGAGAAMPNSSSSAQLGAANNLMRGGSSMANQQAMNGIQERGAATGALNQSQNQVGQMQLGSRGQDLNAANGAYGVAGQAYGNAIQYPQKTSASLFGGAAGGAAGGVASMFSDKRLKKNITSADDDATKSMSALKAYRFDYKDQKHGAGNQFGIMAQDLERAGLKHVIIEKREGKAVDTGRLSLANTAMVAALNKRVKQLEAK